MNEPEFSIIIPVYNSAEYLRECLDSVIAQTYTKWEAICIDDGSTDESSKILDEYCKNDCRFIIRHQSNKGASEARNLGLQLAKGRWIAFLDSDDFYHHELLRRCEKIISDHPEIDMITFSTIYATSPKFKDLKEMSPKILDFSNIIPHEVENHNFVENIYRRSIGNDIIFEPYIVCEDRLFLYNWLTRVSKCALIPLKMYAYRKHMDSTIHSSQTFKKVKDEMSARMEMLHIIRKSSKRKFATPYMHQNETCVLEKIPYNIIQIQNICNIDEIWSLWRQAINEIVSWNTLSFQRKIRCLLTLKIPQNWLAVFLFAIPFKFKVLISNIRSYNK